MNKLLSSWLVLVVGLVSANSTVYASDGKRVPLNFYSLAAPQRGGVSSSQLEPVLPSEEQITRGLKQLVFAKDSSLQGSVSYAELIDSSNHDVSIIRVKNTGPKDPFHPGVLYAVPASIREKITHVDLSGAYFGDFPTGFYEAFSGIAMLNLAGSNVIFPVSVRDGRLCLTDEVHKTLGSSAVDRGSIEIKNLVSLEQKGSPLRVVGRKPQHGDTVTYPDGSYFCFCEDRDGTLVEMPTPRC